MYRRRRTIAVVVDDRRLIANQAGEETAERGPAEPSAGDTCTDQMLPTRVGEIPNAHHDMAPAALGMRIERGSASAMGRRAGFLPAHLRVPRTRAASKMNDLIVVMKRYGEYLFEYPSEHFSFLRWNTAVRIHTCSWTILSSDLVLRQSIGNSAD